MRLRNSYVFIFFVVLILFLYWRLPFTFWQQDEWHHLGVEYVWHQKGIVGFLAKDVLSPTGIRFLPLAVLANYFQFSVFNQSPAGYAVVSLLLHIINTILVFLLVKKLSKNRLIGFFAGIFFASMGTHFQATTWLIQHTTTLPAVTFSLLSLVFLFNEKIKLAIISSLAAILFKETAFFVFPASLLLVMIYKEKIFSKYKEKVKLFLGFGFISIIGLFLYFDTSIKTIKVIPAVIAQSIFQDTFWRAISRFIATNTPLANSLPLPNTAAHDLIVENVISGYVMGAFALLFVVMSIKYFKKTKNKVFLAGVLLVLLPSIPLMFIPALSNGFSYLDSRYMYAPAIGSSILLAIFSHKIMLKSKILLVVPAVFVLANSYFVINSMKNKAVLGEKRRAILNQISSSYPNLTEKAIFYTKSDKAYYGLPPEENILPFQSGFGQVLLAWYHPSENFPIEFFEDNYLWDITTQGYQEINGTGFGYFRDFDLLKEAVEQYNVPKDSIKAFSWKSESELLFDITDEITDSLE